MRESVFEAAKTGIRNIKLARSQNAAPYRVFVASACQAVQLLGAYAKGAKTAESRSASAAQCRPGVLGVLGMSACGSSCGGSHGARQLMRGAAMVLNVQRALTKAAGPGRSFALSPMTWLRRPTCGLCWLSAICTEVTFYEGCVKGAVVV